MELQTVSGERKWVVCFTKQCYDLFCKVNESQTKGVIIKKPRIQNGKILITDYTKVSISTITQCMTKDLKLTNIATVLGEAALYLIFKQLLVMSDIDNHEHDENIMAVRTAVVHEKTCFATVTVFSQLTKEIADGKSYQFTNVNVGQSKKEHVLKTTEMTKIALIENLDINIYEHNVVPNTVTFDRKFTSIQLGGLTIVYQCPKCYAKVDIKDEMTRCDHCSIVSAEDQCSSKCEVGSTIMNTDTKVKYVVVPHNILKEVALVSLEEKITLAKLLLNGTYTFKTLKAMQFLLSCVLQNDFNIKGTLTSNLRWFLVLLVTVTVHEKKLFILDKIPEKSL